MFYGGRPRWREPWRDWKGGEGEGGGGVVEGGERGEGAVCEAVIWEGGFYVFLYVGVIGWMV